MSNDSIEEPDRVDGAPHPRETLVIHGQDAAEADFLGAYTSGRLHSGWLLTGPQGIGKATLAYRIATFLLAEEPPGDAGLFGAPPPPTTLTIDPNQTDARLVRAGSHPRLCIVRRSADDKTGRLRSQITVDEVRRLGRFFHLSATDGGRRVVIVDAADEMNPNAANAILKLLEEPPARTTLLLIAHQPQRLLPTIRSRCRVLRMAPLGPDALTQALAIIGPGEAPGAALAVLTGGSVGAAVRMAAGDGLALYRDLVTLFEGLPNINRARALALSDACSGKGADGRFDLTLTLIDLFLARTARAGVAGEPGTQGAAHEARLLARLSPHDHAARRWASLQQELGARVRHGRAVNLDPAALILDMLFRIEDTARTVAAA